MGVEHILDIIQPVYFSLLITGFIGLGIVYIVVKLCKWLNRPAHSSPMTESESIARYYESSDMYVKLFSYIQCNLSTHQLPRHCMKLRVLGFDCEWNSKRSREPVALLQLAAADGYCILIRLCLTGSSLPDNVKTILADPTIYKVGVGAFMDAKYLKQDYGLMVRGCLDLRHLIICLNGKLPRGGLSAYAKDLLGVEMDKSPMWTNWEDTRLSAEQIDYAFQDVIVAVNIFSHLVRKLVAPRQVTWTAIVDLCEPYVDVNHPEHYFQPFVCDQ